MASPVRRYHQEIHDNLGFFATWLPGDTLEIGDVGRWEGGKFRHATSLEELGIPFAISEGRSVQDIQYTSKQGTKIAASSKAMVSAVAKVEISIEFSSEGAFVFHASNLRLRQLENRAVVAKKLLKNYEMGRWDKSWLLVESLHTADRATIIVSEDSSSGLVLAASTEGPLTSVFLADPKINLTLTSTRGRIMHVIGSQRLHPLYLCLRLKESFLTGEKTVEPVRGSALIEAEPPFSRPAIDELLRS
jgi:hypothetical protein